MKTTCKHAGLLVALVVALLALTNGSTPICTPVEPDAPLCEVDGELYEPGDSFPASDGCNTCSCMSDGSVACTEMFCGCSYDGELYAPGDSFPSTDGCNTCSCMNDGGVACTEMACGCSYAGAFYQYGETFWADDGCNKCTCMAGGVACTKMWCECSGDEWFRDYKGTPDTCPLIKFYCPANTTYFANDCGCGCQQSADCPEWFNCMPPAPCDPAQIEEDCPYSVIAW